MAETTPVTVLTGFLGAGKTTLLNHLLRQPELTGTAVLVNEFGEIGLDHLLVEKLDDTTILLNAGCLCCTIRGDLARVLREMLPRARRGDISRIIIETTGLADPVPILTTLMTDAVAASAYRLDGIVTVIDAVNGATHLDLHEEAVRQVAVADRIVISKADLADASSLRIRLHRLNPGAPVIEAQKGVVAPGSILNAGLFDAAGKIADVRAWLHAAAFQDGEPSLGRDHSNRHHNEPSNGTDRRDIAPDGDGPNHQNCYDQGQRSVGLHSTKPDDHGRHSTGRRDHWRDDAGQHNYGQHNPRPENPRQHGHHGQHHDVNRHDARISAFCLSFDQPLHWPGLAMWLEMLVASKGQHLLRVKGILNLQGEDRPVAVHVVRHLIHPPVKLAAWPADDTRTSRLVFITCDLPRGVVEPSLRAFQAAAASIS